MKMTTKKMTHHQHSQYHLRKHTESLAFCEVYEHEIFRG
jgi:hypothetical protein